MRVLRTNQAVRFVNANIYEQGLEVGLGRDEIGRSNA